MSNLSEPLVRFSTSCANLRTSRSRKSPESIVPPGNWCEILRVVDCACARMPASASGTKASEPASRRRRERFMASSKTFFLLAAARAVRCHTTGVRHAKMMRQRAQLRNGPAPASVCECNRRYHVRLRPLRGRCNEMDVKRGMSRLILSLFATVLAVSLTAAQPAIDYARENRWAQEVVPSIVVGDAVWLATPARAKVLAILAMPSGTPKGGVVVVHGLGVHPDFGMIGGIRTYLADAGYATLSVQMPVLPADASRDDYSITLPDAAGRIGAAIAFLRTKGIEKIAIVSHSMGATMADASLARVDAAKIEDRKSVV